jgi:putative NADH-flavin reductase
MKITVFGAAGRTGQHVIRKALAAGHNVTAYVHHASRLDITDERLTVVEGDIREDDKVSKVIKDMDAVISVLGPSSNQQEYVISQGMANILGAMKTHQVKRLIVSVGAGVGDPQDTPGMLDRVMNLLLKLTARHVYEDMRRVAERVRNSDRAWTLVRVPMLTDAPGTGDLRVGYLGKGVGARLSREDMATFMVKQLDDETYLHRAPVISN